MKRKGFTLIELLAVIVILAIIALISTPIIIGVIEKARKGAFEDSAYGVLDAGRIYFVDKIADQNKFEGATFLFPDGGDLKISGEKPAGGALILNSNGKQALAIYDKDKKWCALKKYNEEKIKIQTYKEEECTVIDTLATHIQDKNIEGNTEGLFTDDFGNTRYRGASPKNYVTFNNELWRMIGVFDGKVKMIRESKEVKQWSTTNENDWNTSSLQTYLNEEYYNSLPVVLQNQIASVRYFLGGLDSAAIDKKQAYTLEKSTNVYTDRPTVWDGKIGLMYPSDYGYAAGETCQKLLSEYNDPTCLDYNYLYQSEHYQWTLTPYFTNGNSVYVMAPQGYINGTNSNINFAFFRPVLYLKSSVKVIAGIGTSGSPYALSIS